MDPGIYKFIHYIGIFFLLSGVGGIIFAEKDKIKLPVISHGIGLLLILLGGFGMQAKMHIGFPAWFIAKLAIWLVLGAALVIAKRQLLPPVATWALVVILSSIAAWLGLTNSVVLR
jgi:hypothetical protein